MIPEAEIEATERGAILFDATRMGRVPRDAWFDPTHWQSRGEVHRPSGGRGAAYFVHTQAGPAVLRHYRRGGWIARFNQDRYLWQSEERVRSFHEFRMLAAAAARALPVPLPLAARYVRDGWWYRADLLVLAIGHATTLAEKISQSPSTLIWERIGEAIGRFHAQGFFHADLNAHNIMLRGSEVFLIDLDRAEQRPLQPGWQQANLARLRRSLLKLGVLRFFPGFEREEWVTLVCAHSRVAEEAA